jgi:thioredoxin reductase/NAD-dependent dihydropyrimidine dehydrogenase PreA subunit
MYFIFGLVLFLALRSHMRTFRRKERAARVSAEHAGLSPGDGPKAQHPLIDVSSCIGCGACVDVCPEGEVLMVLGGKAALVHGSKCIGHGLCAEACPVGAIEIVMAPPGMTADLPALTPELESTVPNLFIAGELGGLALIKNAVNQGRDCVDVIAGRRGSPARPRKGAVLDLCIVGAGPAGLSASLRAIERKLSFVTLEAEQLGGAVAKYPRQKLVMTSPVEFPLHGKFHKLEIGKEELLAFWQKAASKAGLEVQTGEPVQSITRDPDGAFTIGTNRGQYRAQAVVLAIGRRGTPRKLGIPGEELPHVMYSLLDAEAYTEKEILVVGGGDSAVEAALGLAHQRGNRVTLSYRRGEFSRLKDRNRKQIEAQMRAGKLTVLFNSQPEEIRVGSVELAVDGVRRRLLNDYTWIFAGGTAPNEFLERVGIGLGRQDLQAQVQEVLTVRDVA